MQTWWRLIQCVHQIRDFERSKRRVVGARWASRLSVSAADAEDGWMKKHCWCQRAEWADWLDWLDCLETIEKQREPAVIAKVCKVNFEAVFYQGSLLGGVRNIAWQVTSQLWKWQSVFSWSLAHPWNGATPPMNMRTEINACHQANNSRDLFLHLFLHFFLTYIQHRGQCLTARWPHPSAGVNLELGTHHGQIANPSCQSTCADVRGCVVTLFNTWVDANASLINVQTGHWRTGVS